MPTKQALNPMFRIMYLELNKLGYHFRKSMVVYGQKAHVRPSSGDASIKTTKYMMAQIEWFSFDFKI